MEHLPAYKKGRGAQLNPDNPFSQHAYSTTESEGLDEAWEGQQETTIFHETPASILNPITSPDVPGDYSLNPYQGCEHGCVYCYARNTHQYYGFSAGLDFESKIIVKLNAAETLRKALNKKSWEPTPIMFSGNTDCYQPLEKTYKLTRQCLEILAEFGNPVSIVTKNSLILRDLDLLTELARRQLVHVMVSVTTLNEELRRKMEPRTAPGRKRIDIIQRLSAAGVPTGVLMGPVIPGLNQHEAADILQACADAGATAAGYTYVRLNGSVGQIFEDWIQQAFPDRASKVLNQIREAHGGKLSDSRFGTRMRGEGELAEGFARFFKLLHKQLFADRSMPPYNLEAFRRPGDGQLSLF